MDGPDLSCTWHAIFSGVFWSDLLVPELTRMFYNSGLMLSMIVLQCSTSGLKSYDSSFSSPLVQSDFKNIIWFKPFRFCTWRVTRLLKDFFDLLLLLPTRFARALPRILNAIWAALIRIARGICLTVYFFPFWNTIYFLYISFGTLDLLVSFCVCIIHRVNYVFILGYTRA